MTAANDFAVRRALEGAGVEFIDENGGGPRLAPAHGPAGQEAQTNWLSLAKPPRLTD